jgi:hypothetical protein
MYEMDQYTVSLLHFDDGLKDESGKVWTANGGVVTSTTESKFGESSLYCSARAIQWIETPAHPDFNVGSGDFTIECWVKIPDSEINQNMLGQGTYNSLSDYHYGVILCISSTGKLRTQAGSAPNSLLFDIASKTTITDNIWHHVAVIRSGNKVYLSVDGILETSTNVTGSVYSDTSPFRIIKSNNASYGAIGYYDEFRFSKGIARWTSDFDPSGAINAPNNLTATAGDSLVTLSWTAVDGAVGYNVKRSITAGGPYTTIATNVTGTSYIDNTVTNGTTYYYVVTAVDGSGSESANSNEASATPEGHDLLRITMNDSSEREYEVNTTELTSFLAWFNRTISTGTSYYSFDKTVGSQSSTEYLAFKKIISFKAITENDQVILKIIMSDSSEREYKVSSADAFVNWYGRTVSPCTSGTTYYEFTDSVDGSTEYLAFEKIISFEVIPLTE